MLEDGYTICYVMGMASIPSPRRNQYSNSVYTQFALMGFHPFNQV